MTKTHRSVFEVDNFEVTAWQFSLIRPIPLWVARSFHRIDTTIARWESLAADGHIVVASQGDWAVCIDDTIVVVLKDFEFHQLFRLI